MMKLETKPLGSTYDFDESTICELNWGTGLRIVVELWNRHDPDDSMNVEYYWSGFTRHRVLEESDLAEYWSNGDYQQGYLLFEVLSGGWMSNAPSENINIWCGKEWLLYTSNLSATVICDTPPIIREL